MFVVDALIKMSVFERSDSIKNFISFQRTESYASGCCISFDEVIFVRFKLTKKQDRKHIDYIHFKFDSLLAKSK